MVATVYFLPTLRCEVDRFVSVCRTCKFQKRLLQMLDYICHYLCQLNLRMILAWILCWVCHVFNKGWILYLQWLTDSQKMAHFIIYKKTTDVVNVAQLYFIEVYWLHGLPSYIVFYKDTRFLCHFWRMLWKMINTKLNFSNIYHPSNNGQSK